MNKHRDNEDLLRNVLGEGAFAARRDALLENTLRHVRRRRRLRCARQAAYVVAFVSLAAATLLLKAPRHPSVETRLMPPIPKPYLLVETQPLLPAALVASEALSTGKIVTTSGSADIQPATSESFPTRNVISTVPTRLVVTTASNEVHPKELNDDALLALAAPNPAVLVRRGDGKAELFFVNSTGSPPE